jgi:hypothetical protein
MADTATETPEQVSRTSLWEDFIDIYLSPRQVFERRRDSGFVAALVVLTLVITVLAIPTQMSMAGMIEATIRETLENSGNDLPAERIEQMAGISTITGTLGALVATPVGVLLSGLLLWGLSALLGISMTPTAGMMIATYSVFPRIWSMVATMLQAGLLDPARIYDVSVGPARFLDAGASPLVLGLAGRLDVFILWSVVLVAIGVAVVGRTTLGRAAIVAVALWALASLPAVAGVFLGAMAAG